jgi:hypothetical protein
MWIRIYIVIGGEVSAEAGFLCLCFAFPLPVFIPLVLDSGVSPPTEICDRPCSLHVTVTSVKMEAFF